MHELHGSTRRCAAQGAADRLSRARGPLPDESSSIGCEHESVEQETGQRGKPRGSVLKPPPWSVGCAAETSGALIGASCVTGDLSSSDGDGRPLVRGIRSGPAGRAPAACDEHEPGGGQAGHRQGDEQTREQRPIADVGRRVAGDAQAGTGRGQTEQAGATSRRRSRCLCGRRTRVCTRPRCARSWFTVACDAVGCRGASATCARAGAGVRAGAAKLAHLGRREPAGERTSARLRRMAAGGRRDVLAVLVDRAHRGG